MQVTQVQRDYPSKLATIEAALSASQELNRAILTSLDDQLAILDRSGQIIAVNEAWTQYGKESCIACRLQHQCQVFRRQQYFNKSGPETQAAKDGIQSVIEGSRESFEMEYQCPTASGQRWFRMSVTSLGDDGVGAIVSHREVTQRKEVEEKLQELTGQLINAQEEERRRIARELHDDLNQRLALLIIDLEQLGARFPEKRGDLRKQLQELGARAREISTDVHRMSYQLHPSKLETLGLVAAVRGLCNEVSERHGLKIVFSHRDVPGSISKDVALCLFRVAQESLHNTVKHSGSKQARVELTGNQQTINLIISDTGAGFDVDSARKKGGLGLVSMEERLRLVGGEISIHSQPARGARIEVKVSLSVKPPDTL